MNTNKNTILFVEEEARVQKMLRILLDEENFTIIESASGKEAVRVSQAFSGKEATIPSGKHPAKRRIAS